MNNGSFISWEDFRNLFFRQKRHCLKVAWIAGLCAFIYFLAVPPSYLVHATFKQSATKNDHFSDMKNIFIQTDWQGAEPKAATIMYSQRVLAGVAESLGLQIKVKGDVVGKNVFRNALDNIISEFGGTPIDLDRFIFRDVIYRGEKPLKCELILHKGGKWEVRNRDRSLMSQGNLGEKIDLSVAEFVIEKVPSSIKEELVYPIIFLPMPKVIDFLLKHLEIKASRSDTSLLHLTFQYRDRQLGMRVLNQIMAGYQEYLKIENEEALQDQISFLEKRHKELLHKFEISLDQHVTYLRDNLGENGFMSFENEMNLLEAPKEKYGQRLFEIDLRLKRTQKQSSDIQLSTTHTLEELDFKQKALLSGVKEGLKNTAVRIEDYPPLDLASTEELYEKYNREMDEVQSKISQLNYFCGHLQQPDFELSSLSSVLSDPVSLDMVQSAAKLALQMHDESNRSEREHHRIKETLQVQKRFLAQHLSQMLDLYQLRLQLIANKIDALQKASIHLIQNERGLLESKLAELKEKMADLPKKWKFETQLKLEAELTKKIIEGMSHLVETKNLDTHLFQVASKPLDFASSPRKPIHPHLFFHVLIAALGSAMIVYSVAFWRGIIVGFPVNATSLKAYGEYVCGAFHNWVDQSLSEFSQSDLATLRRVVSYIEEKDKKVIAIILGKSSSYLEALSELFKIKGKKVLLIHADFQSVVRNEDIPGLWQYLNCEIERIPIREKDGMEWIPSGGTGRHGAERLSHIRFQTLIQSFSSEYDHVLLYSHARPASRDAQVLFECADGAVISTIDESIEDLAFYRNQQKNVAYLTYPI